MKNNLQGKRYMIDTFGPLFQPDGSTLTLLAETLTQGGKSLRLLDGCIEAVPPFKSALGQEVMASAQKPLLAAYNGARRDQPLEPAHLYVCEAGCMAVLINKRKKTKCSICGVSRDGRRLDLAWIDLPKKPKKPRKAKKT